MWHQDYPNLSINLYFPGSSVVKNSPANAGDFPDSSVGKESACNSGDPDSNSGLGRSPGEGKGYPLQYSGLEYSPWGLKRVGHDWATFIHTHQFNPQVRKIPWRKKWQPAPVFMPGKPHGQRSLVDCSPWSCKIVGHDWVTKQWQNNGNKSVNLIYASRIVCIYVNIQLIPMFRYL